MAFSGSQTTGLNVYATPGRVQSFSAKTEAVVKKQGNLLTLKVGT